MKNKKELLILIFSFFIGIFLYKIYYEFKIEKEREKEFKKFIKYKDLYNSRVTLLKISNEKQEEKFIDFGNLKEITLLIYFRFSDCGSCLDEMLCIIDKIKNFKTKLNIIIMTDHPILEEILYFKKIYPQLSEIYWDREQRIGNLILSVTPLYIIFKKNKIWDMGIIASQYNSPKFTFCDFFIKKLGGIR